jgi:hypothetical protein
VQRIVVEKPVWMVKFRCTEHRMDPAQAARQGWKVYDLTEVETGS